jgi:hypothetical protein
LSVSFGDWSQIANGVADGWWAAMVWATAVVRARWLVGASSTGARARLRVSRAIVAGRKTRKVSWASAAATAM